MKKFALALLCIVSVAFFASCNKDDDEAGNPTINFVSGEGYISSDTTLEAFTPFKIGIQAKSNETTKELLTKCQLQLLYNGLLVKDTLLADNINQEQYNFDAVLGVPEGEFTFITTIYNTEGKTDECRMTITSVVTDTPIEASAFEWFRWGNHEQHGLEEFGLYWDQNRNAIIVPTDGTTLFTGFTKEEWDAVTTENQKTAFFQHAQEAQQAATEYTGISTNGSGPVEDVIGTITSDGVYHLLYVEKIQFGEFGTYGYPMTVTGQAK